MNKNTLTGLLLMGLVIMTFMYLNKPSQEELEAREKARQEQVAQGQAKSEAPQLTLDSITPEERGEIISTIRANGVYNAETGVHTLSGPDVVLTLAADSSTVGGEVRVNGQIVPAARIMTADYEGIDTPVAIAALKAVRNTLADAAKYQGFARFRSGSDSTVTIHNDVLSISVSTKGGVITTAELLDPKYTKYDVAKKANFGQVSPIAPGENEFGFIIDAHDRYYDTRELYFEPVVESDSSILMKVTPGDGAMLGLRYTLRPGDSYLVDMELVQENMGVVIPETISSIQFVWNQTMARNELGRVFESQNSAIYYMLGNDNVDNLSEQSNDREEINEAVKWVAYKNQFFSTLIVPRQAFTKADLTSTVIAEDQNAGMIKQMDMTARMEYRSNLANPVAFTFFIGPNSYPLLSDLSDTIQPDSDLKLTHLVPLGWSLFRWINTWIVIPVFDFLGKYIANYGIIILLLTIFIKIILFPFTYKSYMSQAKMRVLAPEIKEINDRYPGKENAMRRQQETMALYSRAGASPLSGCLPMLLQLPILIAMFRFFPSAIELRGESFLWAADLSAPDAIIPLPFAIPFLGDKLSLFCLLMTVVNIIYTRINMQNQPGGASMPSMKWMMYMMPVMFLFFFNNYAAGLSYYYLLSLLITIVQTYVFRLVVNEEKVRATMKANAAKPKKKSGFMARLEEAQRKQQAMLREQEKQRGKKGGRR